LKFAVPSKHTVVGSVMLCFLFAQQALSGFVFCISSYCIFSCWCASSCPVAPSHANLFASCCLPKGLISSFLNLSWARWAAITNRSLLETLRLRLFCESG